MNARTIRSLSIALFVSLIVWGGFTYIVYLGIPVHGFVYLNSNQAQTVAATCGDAANIGTYVCRGTHLFLPFLAGLLKMLWPLTGYIVSSLAIFGALFAYRGFKTGHFGLPFVVRPVHLIALFAISVWMLGTTISLGSTERGENGMPFNRFFEPTPALYGTVSEQGMAELRANYQNLLDRGCLKPYQILQNGSWGQAFTKSGAKVYELKFLCMQSSLFARAGTQLLLILILMLDFLVAGRMILRSMKLHGKRKILEFTFALGLGAFAWVAALWIISVLGILKPAVLLPLFFGLPLVGFLDSKYWILSAVRTKLHLESKGRIMLVLLAWLVVSYLALNFLNVVRPFPIGWDDLGSYLNRPRLLASYGSFIPTMPTFQWEYLSAMAYAMFGLESIVGSTFAMIINWSAGLLTVIVTYMFARLFIGHRAGLLAAMLYYFLPMTGHFSFADMKIDNASYFTSVLALLGVFVYLFGTPGLTPEHRIERGDKRYLIIAGLLAGFSFAIKPTAVLMIFMMSSVIGGALFGPWGFAALAAASFAMLQQFAPFSVYDIAQKIGIALPLERGSVRLATVFLLLAVAAAFFALSLKGRKQTVKEFIRTIGWLLAGFTLAVAPWMTHNFISNGGALNVSNLIQHENNISPYVTYVQKEEVPANLPVSEDNIRYLPPELKLDPNHPACKTSARTEELDRYWGFGSGVSHYLTLPWRAVMNYNATGYYVTLIPTLLLLPLLLLLPYFWTREARWLRLLFAGTFVFLVQWIFTANGIIWYGIGMFLGFAVCLEALYRRAPDTMSRTAMGVLITLGIAVAMVNRMWQFDVQRNLFEYPLGKVTAGAIREVTIPDYDDIRDSVVHRHETMAARPYTYRMGTFIPYFIPKNMEIFPLADHQLQFFNCVDQERDHALTTKRLKALGFNSIIFDTNTATIERDPNGTLHQKVNAFLDYANDPASGVQIVINNPTGGIVYMLIP